MPRKPITVLCFARWELIPEYFRLTDLKKVLDCSPSTAHKLIKKLLETNLIEKTEFKHLYHKRYKTASQAYTNYVQYYVKQGEKDVYNLNSGQQ